MYRHPIPNALTVLTRQRQVRRTGLSTTPSHRKLWVSPESAVAITRNDAFNEPEVLADEDADYNRSLRVLLVDDSDERRKAITDALADVNCQVIGFVSKREDVLSLVQESNPDVVIVDLESPGRDTLDSLRSIQSVTPRPIVMFSQDDQGATIARATRAGVSAYVVDGISRKRVRPILDAAILRFQQLRGMADELEKTRTQLEERKTIDKAKTLLMKQRGMSEDEAYKALRSQAMSTNRRLADIAGIVVEAAQILIKP
ncbi:MAG: ANTAR domain-containing protein [Granulosicoccus sp.]|nr:ANTAR domain-containing protein [Granulosicoccus sp.]